MTDFSIKRLLPYMRMIFAFLCLSSPLVFPIASAASSSSDKSVFYATAHDVVLLKVDKKKLTADLFALGSMNSYLEPIKSFQIAIGKESGDKFKEGDNRTPEGVYFAEMHIDSSSLLKSKYGPAAVPVDFPNPVDRYQKKTGYGIWLHGAGNDERMAEKQVTEGCVAFLNADILDLKNWMQPRSTIVAISQDSDAINRSIDVAAVQRQTMSWLEAWKNKDIDHFTSLYHSDFRLQGRGKEQYREYKGSLFKRYKEIEVKLFDLFTVTHPKYAVTVFNQDFKGDSFVSNGRKVLYWLKNEKGEWKILREVFDNQRFRKLSYLIPTNTSGRQNIQAAKPILF